MTFNDVLAFLGAALAVYGINAAVRSRGTRDKARQIERHAETFDAHMWAVRTRQRAREQLTNGIVFAASGGLLVATAYIAALTRGAS